jgi:hypothetical protein
MDESGALQRIHGQSEEDHHCTMYEDQNGNYIERGEAGILQ